LKRTTINVQNSEGLPLSDAVRFGDLLFVSGMVGMDAAGTVVAGGIAAETHQAFRNIAAVLAAAGAHLSDVLKVNVILTRAEDFAAFNAAYREIFPTDPPARVSMVAGLTIDACVEIDVVAGLPGS
jgi:2-iminobutanoate/2-iminopropanoate deaminase